MDLKQQIHAACAEVTADIAKELQAWTNSKSLIEDNIKLRPADGYAAYTRKSHKKYSKPSNTPPQNLVPATTPVTLPAPPTPTSPCTTQPSPSPPNIPSLMSISFSQDTIENIKARLHSRPPYNRYTRHTYPCQTPPAPLMSIIQPFISLINTLQHIVTFLSSSGHFGYFHP